MCSSAGERFPDAEEAEGSNPSTLTSGSLQNGSFFYGVKQLKYAFFGGSFNPIHNGHIIVVQKMLDYLEGLEKLFIIPAGCSPFKTALDNQLPFEDRYQWCVRSFDGIEKIQVLDIERNDEADEPSYTYKTLERFYHLYGQYPVLIIGEDSLASFHRWKNFERILDRCDVAVFRRKGYSANKMIEEKYQSKITIYNTPFIEISSTEIRNRIGEEKSIRGYVPQTLEEAIVKKYRRKSDANESS